MEELIGKNRTIKKIQTLEPFNSYVPNWVYTAIKGMPAEAWVGTYDGSIPEDCWRCPECGFITETYPGRCPRCGAAPENRKRKRRT